MSPEISQQEVSERAANTLRYRLLRGLAHSIVRGVGLFNGLLNRVERFRETRKLPVPEDINGEPITCLRCGAFNDPHSQQCSNCGTRLVVPDLDFNLLLRVAAQTSVGRVRKNNEDNVNVWAGDGTVLALVADGMGGAVAGEEASRLVVESVQADFVGDSRSAEKLQLYSEDQMSGLMHDTVHHANRAIVDRAREQPSLKGMGTTSTLMAVRGNQAFTAHVGDSRAYIVDATGLIRQITEDHSFVQALVASGHITAEEARTHPMGNVLYRALGQSLDLEVDTYVTMLHSGDKVVLCSDGLTRHLEDHEIADILHNAVDPQQAANSLIDLANERGGEDNISVVVIMVDEYSG
jgi:PPM family protein phosphatase